MQVLQMEEVTFAPRLIVVPRRIRFERPQDTEAERRESATVPGWQVEAVEEYEESLQPLETRLRGEMACRVVSLTGQALAPEQVYVDPRSQVAVAKVDGLVFKLLRRNLVITRPCVQCNTGQYTSPPLSNRAELGYMLTDWEPRCATCVPEDSAYWIYES